MNLFGNGPVFAPPGGEGEGDSDTGGFDEIVEEGEPDLGSLDDNSFDLDDSELNESLETGPDDDEITLDAGDVLGDLFKQPKGKDTQTPSQDGPSPQEVIDTQKRLTTELTNSLTNMTLPADLIPDDFNPSDPKQMMAMLARVQKDTAQKTIAIMFKPVQAAMKTNADSLRREMKANAKSTVNDSALNQLLEANVGAAKDPKLRPIVDIVFNQAKIRYPNNPQHAVLSTRKALAAMGIKGSSAKKTLSKAKAPGLDLYAPMPKKTTVKTQGTSMKALSASIAAALKAK